MSRIGVFVEGIALEISHADRSRNLSELIFGTVRRAVDDAEVDLDSIDSVVLAAHDLVDGRSLSSMVTAPAAAAYLRDEIRYGDDGAGAFAGAMTRLEAGHNRRSIVAAWGRSSEHDPAAVSRALFDPVYLRPLGLSELHVSAMRAQAWLQHHGSQNREDAAARRERRAAANPRGVGSSSGSEGSYPLRRDELSTPADVVAAVVIGTEETSVRVTGLGQGSEPYFIGDRDLLAMPALRRAAFAALADAGGLTVGDLNVLEIDGLTLFDDAIGLEAVGAAPAGGGLACLATDERCNPSGGGGAGYCAPAMGLTRIVEAILQLRGAAGPSQVGAPRRAMATGCSTIAAQTQTAVVLEAA